MRDLSAPPFVTAGAVHDAVSYRAAATGAVRFVVPSHHGLFLIIFFLVTVSIGSAAFLVAPLFF